MLVIHKERCILKTVGSGYQAKGHYPDYPIKSNRLDNAGEFTSKTFDDYRMSVGVEVEHPLPHVHTQNSLAEAFIKCLQMIARSFAIRTKLLIDAWGYTILYAAKLVCLRPVATQPFSVFQLVTRHEPDISHLCILLLCGICVDLAALTYKNGALTKDENLCRI